MKKNANSTSLRAPLSIEIAKNHLRLIEIIQNIPIANRTLKTMEGTGGSVSIADFIAYQIGWGNC